MLIAALLLAAPILGAVFARLTGGGGSENISENYLRGSRDALLQVGLELAGGGAIYAAEERFYPSLPVLQSSAAEDFPLRKMVALNLVGFKIPVAAPKEESPAVEPVAVLSSYEAASPAGEAPQPEASSAFASSGKAEEFMERQAVFGGYAIPASVDCSVPALPFDYSAPVSAETTSLFGYRVHPIYGDVRFHYGTDFNVADGDEIHAFADGTVETAGTISGYGLTLILNHGDGYETLYGHCSELLVSVGDRVAAGQLVAYSGHSGQVTGPHLHFELQKDGMYLNPEFYL